MTKIPVSFRLDPDLVRALGSEAERRAISRTEIVSEALRRELGEAIPESFERRVRELARTMPAYGARRQARREGLRPGQ